MELCFPRPWNVKAGGSQFQDQSRIYNIPVSKSKMKHQLLTKSSQINKTKDKFLKNLSNKYITQTHIHIHTHHTTHIEKEDKLVVG